MSAAEFTDEDLMAYADGELAEDRAAALDLALAEDEALAARLGLFVDTRMISADALRPMLDEPVPDHLVQRVRDLAAATAAPVSTVVAFPERPRNRPLWQLPIAASIALAVGLGAGMMLGKGGAQNAGPNAGLSIAAVTDPSMADALTTLASGENRALANGARVEAIATFRAADTALCREFEVDQTDGTAFVSIACHDGQGWRVRLAIASAAVDATGYAPASSLDALDAYLAATEAGAPLEPADEAAALAGLR